MDKIPVFRIHSSSGLVDHRSGGYMHVGGSDIVMIIPRNAPDAVPITQLGTRLVRLADVEKYIPKYLVE